MISADLNWIIINNELHYAAGDKSKFETLKYMLEELHLDVNSPHTEQRIPPIVFAARYGAIETVIYLLEVYHANIDASKLPHNLIEYALENPDINIAQYIADPQRPWIKQLNDGTTPLHIAVLLGDLNTVKQLITENPACIRDENIRGKDALFFAAAYNHSAIRNYLLEIASQSNMLLPSLFQQLNYGSAYHHIRQAQSFEDTGDLDDAFEHYDLARQCLELISIRTPQQQKQLASVYQSMANYKFNKKNYVEALALTQQILNLLLNLLEPYQNIEQIKLSLQQIEQAIRMQEQGFNIQDVPSDHKCFFHAIATQLKLSNLPEVSVDDIRTQALGHIAIHWEHYQVKTDLTKEEYIIRYSNPHEWPDDLLILAVARIFYLTLAIIVELEQSSVPSYTLIFKQPDAQGTVYLLNENNTHFKLLLPDIPLQSLPLQAKIDAEKFDEDVIKHPKLLTSSNTTPRIETPHHTPRGSALAYVRQQQKNSDRNNKNPSVSASILPDLSLLSQKNTPRKLPQEEVSPERRTNLIDPKSK